MHENDKTFIKHAYIEYIDRGWYNYKIKIKQIMIK